MKIAVFGSAFNPPSLGHKSVIERLAHFDKVLLVPSIAHAWGKSMLSFETRVEMLNAFVKDITIGNLDVSTLEKDIYIPNQSVTTYSLLKKLQDIEKDADITFIMGPDNLLQFSKFYKSEDILKNWSVMACPETVSIRSTDIRNAIKNKMDITQLTTPRVADYIKTHQLYE